MSDRRLPFRAESREHHQEPSCRRVSDTPVAGVRCPGPRATASDIVAMSSFFGLIGFGLCLVSVRSVADECQGENQVLFMRFWVKIGLRLG